ncbi:folate-binding protein YgfZ [Ciceribacter sp. L1K22]|uniref:CAF17-like 4Fe-4S cluster assembly/insertion protein YgfZ n=1 Tax=Ciceribacter sp. L1K22 TaxID=2820275 RepID=UPI001ABE1033|nr:folate-binding protein YgfZ [Ciceribacter sp. L1K22]MBO3759642.1 folate-binding protein YgfZ [Ciceribacter sp. L1K22]
MPAAFLPDHVLIRVTGPEAEHFLQNLITTDVESLPTGEAVPGALLTPQGKILFDFIVWREEDGFVLDTTDSQRDGLIKRLTMYKLRSKVEITPAEDPGVTVIWGDTYPDGAVEDARFAAAGIPVARLPGRHGEHPRDGYEALRVLAGIVESGHDFTLEDAFPHDIGFDLNRGVSFKKGCYVGQEVVSRMQHRGTARRRTVILSAETPLPPAGTTISAAGKPIGELGTVAGTRGLAIVRIDRAGEALASGAAVLAGDTPVDAMLPSWTGLSFPTSSEEA